MDPYAKKLCRAYGFDNSILFTIKSSLQTKPEQTAAYLFLFTLLFFAYVVRIFEMPRFRLSKDDTFDWYFNSCWFTVVTLTTIGYGDFSPMTMPGKIVTIALAFWGALLLSLLVIIMSTIFNLDENEKMVLR